MKMAGSSTIFRRNRPGTLAQDFCRWPDESFEEMDSTLAVQQYIQQTIRRDPTNIDSILNMPEFQDEGVWKYEHLRQFCMELNGLAVRLQEDCDPQSCTQMTATEQWIFLCAAHKTPKECPAIDYTRHTLDGAACLLNSNKYFPSRVSIKESSVAKLGSVCRRVYRIFSHAYFHHLNIFEPFEHETFLCRRFTAFVTKYKLMSKDNLIVPIIKEDGSTITTTTSTAMNTGSAITTATTIPSTTVTTSIVATTSTTSTTSTTTTITTTTIATIITNPSTSNVTTTAAVSATPNITTANTPAPTPAVAIPSNNATESEA